MLAPGPAAGQVVRGFTPRYTVNRTGAISLIGNTLLTCSTTGNNGADCAGARSGVGPHRNNNDFTMTYVDVDGDASTFNSSTATLALPSGATVLWAGLYWGANHTAGAGGIAAPDASLRNTVRFATPASGYTTITAAQLDVQDTTYGAFADVTSLVQTAGNGNYGVANVQVGTGANRHAGWSLVVVYQDLNQPLRNLTVFDGYAQISNINPLVSIAFSGFLTPAVGPVRTHVGWVTYEGDLDLTGDDAQLNTTSLTDALNPLHNVFNSTITELGTRVTTKNPDYINQLGFDIDQLDATGVLANGATSATISLSTGGETYYPGAVTFSTELFSPDFNGHIQKTVVDLNGGNVVPTDTLEYTITLTNAGQDGATNVTFIDTIPATTSYVPGSMQVVSGVNPGPRTDAVGDDQADFDVAGNRIIMRLGVGATNAAGGAFAPGASATVRFRVQVSPAAGNGTRIANQSGLTYLGQTLPTSYASVSDGDPATPGPQVTVVIVDRADMTVGKTHAGLFRQGSNGTASYSIRATNSGNERTTAPVTVLDTVPLSLTPTGASGSGWSCTVAGQVVSCSRADVLAASASYPDITIPVNVSFTAPATVTNVAYVSGGGEVNLSNNAAVDVVAISGNPDLAMGKTHAGPFAINGTGVYTLAISNVGRAPTSGTVTVTDQLPVGLGYISAVGAGFTCGVVGQLVTCTSPASIAAGATSTITLTVSVSSAALPSVTNTATVSVPGDFDAPNNTASDPTAVGGVIDVALTKTHAGGFVVGTNGVYTLTVTSLGSLLTSGPITITDTLPSGLSYVSATGTGWSCGSAGQVVTCTSPAGMAPADVRVVTLTVAVAAGAVPQVTNVATVSTPGDAIASNNRATDPTNVAGIVDVAIVKTHTGSFVVGQPGSYTLAVSNVGSAITSGVITVRDTLPAGLTFASAAGDSWTCAANSGVVTCTNPGPLLTGVPSAITVGVNVGAAAMPKVKNTARVATLGDTASDGNNVSTDSAAVTGDFRLAAEKRASRPEVEIGDVLDYTVSIRTLGASPVPGLTITDRLPTGFAYVAGSARAGGTRIADPTGGTGPQLVFTLGTLPPDSAQSLTYRVKVGAGAQMGTNVNSAQGISQSTGAVSNVASAPVQVVGGVFSDRGVIVGKLFMECECSADRVQGAEEVGIPGVRVYLEDGTSAITDVEGKYDFYNVSPRLHVVHVDRTTLPAGAKLIPISNRDAGDGYSRFVDMKNGELHRADFADGSHSASVREVVMARRALGEVNAAAMAPPPEASHIAPPIPASASASASVASEAPVSTTGTTPRGEVASSAGPAGAAAPSASVPGATAATSSNSTPAADSGFHALLPDRTLTEGNSQLPPTPARAAELLGANRVLSGARLHLVLPAPRAPADGNTPLPVTVLLEDSTGAPISARTVVTLETTAGRWEVMDIDPVTPGVQTALVGGRAELELIAATQPARAELRASVGALETKETIDFVPVVRPLVAAGVLQGRLNLSSLTAGALSPANPDDGFEEKLTDISFTSDDGKFTGAARGAMILKGKVKGSYLLTLAYDSERDPQHQLFRDIRPDEFYPVYGDAAIKEFDAQSSDRLYVRIDKNRSFLLYGDFATPHTPDIRQLSAYDRTMTGFEQHLENRRGAVDVFASEGRSRRVVDELPGRGISGPYTLSHPDGLLNSERVTIVTRDRNQPSVILSEVPQQRFVDYTIEPFTGRLVFRVPVPSLDANLNPVSVRVTYESDTGGDAFWSYGVDAHVRVVAPVEVGATFARDDDPGARQQVLGVNSTLRLSRTTFFVAEGAQTDNEGEQRAEAGRVELRHLSHRLEGRLFAAHSDSAFDNPSSTFGAGRTELGARGTFVIDAKTRLLGEALRTEDAVTGGRRSGGMLSVERLMFDRLRVELGYRAAHETSVPADTSIFGATPNNTNAVRAKLTAKVATRASLFGEFEQDVQESDQHRAAVGGEYLFSSRGRVYARHEWITSFDGPYALNGLQRLENTVVGIDADYIRNGQLFSEYRARDAFAGREAEAAIGLRNRWAIKRGVVLNTSFERVNPLTGDDSREATAVTGAIELTGSPLWKGTARLEWRTAPTGDNLLGSVGYARKLSRDFTFLGRSLFDRLPLDQWRERTQLGIAWRQTDVNRWNALARYEHRYDSADSALAPGLRHDANIVSGLVNFQPTRALVLSGRYAAKLANDHTDSLDTRTNAQLLMLRGIVDVTERWDVGLITSALVSDGFASKRYGLGVEAGFIVVRNLRAALGYNIFGFRDQDLTSTGYTSRGVYLDVGFKFDETIFGALGERRGPGGTGGSPP